jgi:hypothetical protein
LLCIVILESWIINAWHNFRRQISSFCFYSTFTIWEVLITIQFWFGRLIKLRWHLTRNLNHLTCIFVPGWFKIVSRFFLFHVWNTILFCTFDPPVDLETVKLSFLFISIWKIGVHLQINDCVWHRNLFSFEIWLFIKKTITCWTVSTVHRTFLIMIKSFGVC